MNKKILIVVAFIIGLGTITAQESRYGMRIGANLSSINSDDLIDELDDSRIGIAVGFFADYVLKDKFRLQPELQFSAQGNKEEEVQVNYLQLPIVVKYEFSDWFNVHLGPQVGLKIWEWEDNTQAEADFSTFDFSALIGIGGNITDNFFVDLRYAFGITNVFEESDGAQIDLDGNNSTIQLSVGYRL